MTRVFLARHGETDHNDQSLLQGQMDVDLNENGVEQARKLAERLSREEVDAVYTSDLARAEKTARMVGVEHGIEPEPLQELRERAYGDLEGEPREIRRKHIEHPDELEQLRPEGGENLDELEDRVRPVINQLRKQYPDGTAVVVAHGWTNRAVLRAVLGSDSGHVHRIRQGNACLNELEYEDYRGWRINRVNDTSHLE